MALTEKQENYCLHFMELGNQSAAYRMAYDAELSNSQTVWNEAYLLHKNPDVAVRISELQKQRFERHKTTTDELIYELATMLRFDPADMYDGYGAFKSIHDMPIEVRKMITEMTVFEELVPDGAGGKILVGYTKKAKTIDKLAAIEKLAKHLGLYEADNFQKKTEVNVLPAMSTEELVKRAKALKDLNDKA